VTGFPNNVKRIVQDRAKGSCEQCGTPGFGFQFHHRRPRGMGGSKASDTNTASNCVMVCDRCHRFIESYRKEFTDKGWLVPQGQNPSEMPLWRFGRWVLLDDEGNITVKGDHRGVDQG